MSNENNNLSLYGWSDNLFRQKQISQFKDMSHGRIIVTHKTCYEVVAEDGVYLCELTGNMIYGRMPDEYPCTGDWVKLLITRNRLMKTMWLLILRHDG